MIKFSWLPIGFVLLIFSPEITRAEQLETSLSAGLKNYVIGRKLNQNIEAISSTFDDVYILDLDVSAKKDLLHFKARPEIRGMIGDSNKLNPASPSYIQLQSPERWFDLRWHLGNPPDATTYGDWEELNLSVVGESSEIYFGRRAIGLGVMKGFPIWNKFSKPLPGITTIPVIYGSDGFGGRIQFGEWSLRSSGILSNKGQEQAYFGEAAWYGEELELHFLGGYWWTVPVFGLAAVKDVEGSTLTFEGLFRERTFQGGFGFERALSSKLSLLAEALYQSDGATSAMDYNPYLNSHFRSLQAIFYTYLQASYQASEKWKLQLTGITNWVDRGTDLNGEATVSLSDHLDLTFGGNVPCGVQNSEFSSQSFQFTDGSHFGLPLQFFVRAELNY